jgi:hypothetical protein
MDNNKPRPFGRDSLRSCASANTLKFKHLETINDRSLFRMFDNANIKIIQSHSISGNGS